MLAAARVWRSIGSACKHDVSAGLARVALAEGDTDAEPAALQPLLDHVAASGTFEGTIDTRWIELTGQQVLARARDQRAADWLARARTALIKQAEAIPDAGLRQAFLHNPVPPRDSCRLGAEGGRC